MAHKHLDCVTSTGPLSGILARLPRSKTYDIEQVLVTSRDIQHYHHLPFSRKVSCKLGNLHLEIPELESKICVSAHLFFLRFFIEHLDTHDPSCPFTIRQFLRVSPLVQEIVCSIELHWKSPFPKPQGAVSKRGISLYTIQI